MIAPGGQRETFPPVYQAVKRESTLLARIEGKAGSGKSP